MLFWLTPDQPAVWPVKVDYHEDNQCTQRGKRDLSERLAALAKSAAIPTNPDCYQRSAMNSRINTLSGTR